MNVFESVSRRTDTFKRRRRQQAAGIVAARFERSARSYTIPQEHIVSVPRGYRFAFASWDSHERQAWRRRLVQDVQVILQRKHGNIRTTSPEFSWNEDGSLNSDSRITITIVEYGESIRSSRH